MTAYAGRAALVIGGLGFIGAHVSAALAAAGARVTVLTPLRERHAAVAAAFESGGLSVVEGDVRDRAHMGHLVAGHDVVFNLSGQSGAVRSMEDPWTDLDVNLRGNLVLLDAVRETAPGARVVFIGSRLQYGNAAPLPAREEDGGEPGSLHALHKQTVEQYLALYGRLYGIQYAVARVTNPYGPGQPQGRTAYGVVNRLIHLALAGETLPIYGDGRQQRDYIHVDDVASALLRLGVMPQAQGRVYNVGSGTGTRLIDMAQLIVEVAGAGQVAHVPWPPLAAQLETGDFVADVSRIRHELGWTPATTLREGLERTVAFYRTHATT